jgi:hypothetical protein
LVCACAKPRLVNAAAVNNSFFSFMKRGLLMNM